MSKAAEDAFEAWYCGKSAPLSWGLRDAFLAGWEARKAAEYACLYDVPRKETEETPPWLNHWDKG